MNQQSNKRRKQDVIYLLQDSNLEQTYGHFTSREKAEEAMSKIKACYETKLQMKYSCYWKPKHVYKSYEDFRKNDPYIKPDPEYMILEAVLDEFENPWD